MAEPDWKDLADEITDGDTGIFVVYDDPVPGLGTAAGGEAR